MLLLRRELRCLLGAPRRLLLRLLLLRALLGRLLLLALLLLLRLLRRVSLLLRLRSLVLRGSERLLVLRLPLLRLLVLRGMGPSCGRVLLVCCCCCCDDGCVHRCLVGGHAGRCLGQGGHDGGCDSCGRDLPPLLLFLH